MSAFSFNLEDFEPITDNEEWMNLTLGNVFYAKKLAMLGYDTSSYDNEGFHNSYINPFLNTMFGEKNIEWKDIKDQKKYFEENGFSFFNKVEKECMDEKSSVYQLLEDSGYLDTIDDFLYHRNKSVIKIKIDLLSQLSSQMRPWHYKELFTVLQKMVGDFNYPESEEITEETAKELYDEFFFDDRDTFFNAVWLKEKGKIIGIELELVDRSNQYQDSYSDYPLNNFPEFDVLLEFDSTLKKIKNEVKNNAKIRRNFFEDSRGRFLLHRGTKSRMYQKKTNKSRRLLEHYQAVVGF